jgi:hypothetical protein
MRAKKLVENIKSKGGYLPLESGRENALKLIMHYQIYTHLTSKNNTS